MKTIARMISILALVGLAAFATGTAPAFDGPPGHDTLYTIDGHDFAAGGGGDSWDFTTGPTPFVVMVNGFSSLFGDKYAGKVPAGTYTLTVTITARHDNASNVAAVTGPLLSHNEQGGVSVPEYAFVGTEWTAATFSISGVWTSLQLNGGGLRSTFYAMMGNDADSIRVDVQSVVVTATRSQ